MGIFDGTFRFLHILKAGRPRLRSRLESPLLQNVKEVYGSSRAGILSRQISDKFHQRWFHFSDFIAYKLSLFRIRRNIVFFMSTFGALFVGYVFAGYGTNLYTLGYRQGFSQA